MRQRRNKQEHLHFAGSLTDWLCKACLGTSFNTTAISLLCRLYDINHKRPVTSTSQTPKHHGGFPRSPPRRHQNSAQLCRLLGFQKHYRLFLDAATNVQLVKSFLRFRRCCRTFSANPI